MSSLGVDVHFRRNLGVLKREKVHDGAFDVHRIVLGLNQERGRSPVRDVDIGAGREVLLGEREVGWINEHGEVRTSSDTGKTAG